MIGFFLVVGIFFIFAATLAVLPVQAAEHWPHWAVVAVLPVFLAVLGVFLYFFAAEQRRRKFFRLSVRSGLLGWLSPVLLGVLAFLFAASVFAVVTMLLLDAGLVRLSLPGCATCQPDIGDVLSFYVWNFLDAVPLLNVNESLHWDVPLAYSGALMGWMIIAFKVAVIIPLIQAVRTYLQVRKETPRIRLRPWAWRRAARVGGVVHINWASAPPPDGFVYDVTVARPSRQRGAMDGGDLEWAWITGTTQTSGRYTWLLRPGTYRFWTTCRAGGSERRVESWRLRFSVRPWALEIASKPVTGR